LDGEAVAERQVADSGNSAGWQRFEIRHHSGRFGASFWRAGLRERPVAW
jgi:hypothetical protein